MPTTPPENPAEKPATKRAYVRKTPANTASVKTASTKAKSAKPADAKAASTTEARNPEVTSKPATEAKSASAPATKAARKPKVPARRRATPKSRAPVKPHNGPVAKLAAVPKPTVKQVAVVAAGTSGVIAAIGAAFLLWRASKADQPAYKLIEQDGDFEVREYPGLVTASTETRGPRAASLERGFKTLADYIFARSRQGERFAMTAPVFSDGSDTSGWRTRFIMPAGKARDDLPTPPSGVTLANEPPRRVAAVRFAGRAADADLSAREGALRSWLQLRAFPSQGRAEHAYYNSPITPGPLRRNEVLITLSTK